MPSYKAINGQIAAVFGGMSPAALTMAKSFESGPYLHFLMVNCNGAEADTVSVALKYKDAESKPVLSAGQKVKAIGDYHDLNTDPKRGLLLSEEVKVLS